jgi:predicted Fe-S protein YdhL (DUF1289 family)
MNQEEKKQAIATILLNKLCSVYCDTCDEEYCEGCNRKEMNWGLSKNSANYLAEEILKVIN